MRFAWPVQMAVPPILDPDGVAHDRSSTLAALGAGLLSAAIGAWAAYLSW